MTYATDADLTDRFADASLASVGARALALTDAMAEIDDRVYGATTVRAHSLLAMHYLGASGLLGAGASAGMVTSRKAGDIATTYAVGASSGSGPHASTQWGREFDAIDPGHAPLADDPSGCWPRACARTPGRSPRRSTRTRSRACSASAGLNCSRSSCRKSARCPR